MEEGQGTFGPVAIHKYVHCTMSNVHYDVYSIVFAEMFGCYSWSLQMCTITALAS